MDGLHIMKTIKLEHEKASGCITMFAVEVEVSFMCNTNVLYVESGNFLYYRPDINDIEIHNVRISLNLSGENVGDSLC